MRLLKRIVEMVFIFLVPLMLLLFGLKINKVYDENNNLTSQYLTYENGLFREYNNNLQYKNIFNFNQLVVNGNFESLESWTPYSLNYSISNNIITLEPSIANASIRSPINIINGHSYLIHKEIEQGLTLRLYNTNSGVSGYFAYSSEYNFYTATTDFNQLWVLCDNATGSYKAKNIFIIDVTELLYGNNDVTIDLLKSIYPDKYYNYVESYLQDYFSNDLISYNYEINYTWYNNVLVSLSDHLQFNNNFMIQIIFIYILLIFVNLLLWYSLYVPFDMLFGLLLRKLEYYK